LSRVSYTYSYHNLDEPFQLEQGGIIDQPVIAYNSYGELNENKDNVIFRLVAWPIW